MILFTSMILLLALLIVSEILKVLVLSLKELELSVKDEKSFVPTVIEEGIWGTGNVPPTTKLPRLELISSIWALKGEFVLLSIPVSYKINTLLTPAARLILFKLALSGSVKVVVLDKNVSDSSNFEFSFFYTKISVLLHFKTWKLVTLKPLNILLQKLY